MDIEQVKKDITDWVVGFVEKPHPLLNGWAPCPYARKARVEGKFDIRLGFANPISDCAFQNMETFDVIAYVYPSDKFSAEAFNNLVDNLNDWHLIPKGMWALADHPADV